MSVNGRISSTISLDALTGRNRNGYIKCILDMHSRRKRRHMRAKHAKEASHYCFCYGVIVLFCAAVRVAYWCLFFCCWLSVVYSLKFCKKFSVTLDVCHDTKLIYSRFIATPMGIRFAYFSNSNSTLPRLGCSFN